MTTPVQVGNQSTAASPIGGLADAIDSILDKGLVIDAFVRVSVIGIDLITIEARIVLASVDTYLQFAQAVSQLSTPSAGQTSSLLESRRQARHAAEGPLGPSITGVPSPAQPPAS